MISVCLVLIVALGIGATPPAQPAEPKHRFVPQRLYQLDELETKTSKIKDEELTWYLMDTDAKRMEGMMFLRDDDVKESEGFLFVFPESRPLNFWMKNTLIPLDIAYIDRYGMVLNTRQMLVEPDPSDPLYHDYSSRGSAMYALEMKRGAFEKFGIKRGVQLKIPAGVKAKDRA